MTIANLIKRAESITVLTGAGVSTDSGLIGLSAEAGTYVSQLVSEKWL